MTSLISHISEDLCLDEQYVASVVRRSDSYYKEYTIPKKNGMPRKIAQASPELKSLQYWIVKNILTLLPVSQSSFAYKRGDSAKRHAEYHKNSYFIFHTDVKQFFPSIKSEQLTNILSNTKQMLTDAGLWYEDTCDVISKICFRNNCLCIGTVSSPIISNIIMYEFDELLRAYCNEYKYKYSRYADDIYISSNIYIPDTVQAFVGDALSSLNLQMNVKKTWFKSRKCQSRVTGLIITDCGRISVGKDRRVSIKKMIYDKIVHGKGDPEVVLGHLAFLKDVEPATYNRLLIKYATYCDGDVIAAIKSGSKPKQLITISLELPDI